MTISLPFCTRRIACACIALAAAALIFAACGSDTTPDVPYEPTACDPIDPSMCALPWPSNLYLQEDETTHTGVRLHFMANSLPSIQDPSGWNNLDGYNVSTPIMFKADDLDLSTLPSLQNMQDSWDGEIGQAQIFKVEDDGSLSRVPFWAEQDAHGNSDHPMIYLRPAVILDENAHYIVMLRNLTDTDGNPIERSEAFDELVHNKGGQNPELSGRQAHFNNVFEALETAGIDRDDLYLAWDFHTISHESVHGPMLAARTLVLDWLDKHGGGPNMTIKKVTVYQRDDPNGANYKPHTHYRIEGTFAAPQIVRPIDSKTLDAYVLNTDDEGTLSIYQPDQPRERPFWLRVPYSAVGDGAQPAKLMEFGHGLFGTGNQVMHGNIGRIADEHNYIFFAATLTGMGKLPDGLGDVATAIHVLGHMQDFRYLSDNLHQGIMEYIILAKAMEHSFWNPEKVTISDNVQNFDLDDIQNIHADTQNMYYEGISQGAIFGGTYVAVSPDIQLAHLDVPGMNYSLLLPRSNDFVGGYDIPLRAANRQDWSKVDIQLAAAQILWDMADSVSWYPHLMQDPVLDNDKKKVLLTAARGDHQVTPISDLIAANSNIGLHVLKGWGRDVSHWGIQEIPYTQDGQPYNGSGLVAYHFEGIPWAPDENVPPASKQETDIDPHNLTRYQIPQVKQWTHFIDSGGDIVDYCNGNGCNFKPLDDAQCDAQKPQHRHTDQCWILSDN